MRDNRVLSGRVLVEMGGLTLGSPPSKNLQAALIDIAGGDSREAGLTFRRMLAGTLPAVPQTELDVLRNSKRFCWWLTTLSHSSIVPVCFRGVPTMRRTLLKLEFQQPFAREPRLLSHLGLTPFQVGVDLPWIEARDFHVEVTAPEGLRLLSASLIDDQEPGGHSQKGFLRRVHLVRERAQGAGAGTAILEMLPNTQVFVGGAVTAAVLSLLALGACWYGASAIAAYPTSAPSLLLLIPAVLASYVIRPTVHALTARMLSGARKLLALVALFAYLAAASVALSGPTPKTPTDLHDRTEYLQYMLGTLTLLSLGPTLLLLGSFARSQPKWRATWSDLTGGVWWERQTRMHFTTSGYLRVTSEQLTEQLLRGDAAVRLLSRRSRRVPALRPRTTFAALEKTRVWTWLHELEVERVWQGSQVTITGTLVGPRLLRRFAGGAVRRRRVRMVSALQSLEARTQREARGSDPTPEPHGRPEADESSARTREPG